MDTEVRMDAAYAPSDDVVAREIEGEIIIVPLVAGIGDMEDELFTLNETGKVIWYRLDGAKTLSALAEELAAEFGAPAAEIAQDVAGFVHELVKRRMLIEVS
jgi:hypothetical protein